MVNNTYKKTDGMDEAYLHTISDEIYKVQPFFLTVLLSHQKDTSLEELEELMKVYFLVWEFFRLKPKMMTKKVTEVDFNKIFAKNIQMLTYSEGEKEANRSKIFGADLQHLKSKALMTSLFMKFNKTPSLSQMGVEQKSYILLELKSFVECFENL